MTEQWKPISEIPGYESFTNYELNDGGVLRKIDTKAECKWREYEKSFVTHVANENATGKSRFKNICRQKSVAILFPDTEPAFCKLSDLEGYEMCPDIYDVMANGDIRFMSENRFCQRCTWETCNEGYLCCKIHPDDVSSLTVYKHRLLALMHIPNPHGLPCVDHKNTNRQDNDLENLRWCTYAQNCQNQSLRDANKTGYKGISPGEEKGTGGRVTRLVWRVRVSYTKEDGKRSEKCKNFIRKETDTVPSDEAIEHCLMLQAKYHGEYARIN